MKIRRKSCLWMALVMLLVAGGVVFLAGSRAPSREEKNDQFLAAVIGVHHLGPNYWIDSFYINKRIGDSVGEGGGGGSRSCCVNLPIKSSPKLTADVRWEVRRIKRSSDLNAPETAEVDGIYQATVLVEPYSEPGDLYVHFFSNGRVRIVVSRYTSFGEHHPIQENNVLASREATSGRPITAIFSKEDLEDLQREADRDRKLYGDWR